jgi:hypothetical protein
LDCLAVYFELGFYCYRHDFKTSADASDAMNKIFEEKG